MLVTKGADISVIVDSNIVGSPEEDDLGRRREDKGQARAQAFGPFRKGPQRRARRIERPDEFAYSAPVPFSYMIDQPDLPDRCARPRRC